MRTWRLNTCHEWWTEHYDRFVDERLKEIKEGVGVPLSQRDWRKRIRAAGLPSRVARSLEKHSVTFLEVAIAGGQAGLS